MQSQFDQTQVKRKEELNKTIQSLHTGDEDMLHVSEDRRRRMNKEYQRRESLKRVKELEEQERRTRIQERVRIEQPFLKDIKTLRKLVVATPEDLKREEQGLLGLSPAIFRASPSVFGRTKRFVPPWIPPHLRKEGV